MPTTGDIKKNIEREPLPNGKKEDSLHKNFFKKNTSIITGVITIIMVVIVLIILFTVRKNIQEKEFEKWYQTENENYVQNLLNESTGNLNQNNYSEEDLKKILNENPLRNISQIDEKDSSIPIGEAVNHLEQTSQTRKDNARKEFFNK